LPALVAAKIILLGDVHIRTILYAVLVVGVSDRRTQKELVSMSRMLAALASVALTGLGLLVLLPDCASACSCAIPPGSQKERAERALSSSEAVFSGEVAAIERDQMGPFGGVDEVYFRVSEVWKGPKRETLELTTQSQGSVCGYHFEEEQEYLVYAYGKQDLKVGACGTTKQLSKADEDLALLGNGEKPTDGGDDLTDTSGGVSVRAMVGIAGLAMVASLLVVVRLVRTG
jgi:hypothetical protein